MGLKRAVADLDLGDFEVDQSPRSHLESGLRVIQRGTESQR